MSSLMRMASCTRSVCSPASSKPRSTKTFPDPASTFSRFLAISHLVVLARGLQPLSNQLHIRAGGTNSRRRLLLKAVQRIDRLFEPHRVHHAPTPAAPVL